MKFKTIVIGRKKIIISLAVVCIAAILGISAAIIGTSEKTAAVFKTADNNYEEILSRALPTEDTAEFNIRDTFNKAIGLDLKNPESIISSYSAAFDGVQAENPEGQSNLSEEEKPETTPAPSNPPVDLPSREQIAASVGLSLNNATNYEVDIDGLCGGNLGFALDSDGPQVLIVHTHTTECYDGDEMAGETERSTDENCNVIAVGNVLCDTLESYGIKTYHDTTYHDYPSYQGAYTRTLGTINSILQQYPSIKMVLDIHRDAFVYSDGTKLKVSTEQNGKPTAKVMLVCGTDSMGLEHRNWRENLKLAAKIQNAAEIMYPGLMRPIDLRTERFNMHTTLGSLLIEVGSNGNTLEEAKNGAECVARAMAAVLKNP